MKKLFTFLTCCLATIILYAQSVGINTTPAASAALDVSSTTKGMLVPRMTTVLRNAIASPATGLMVYDITLNSFYFYNGTAWTAIGGTTTVNSFELNVNKTSSELQTTAIGSNLSVPDAVTFSNTQGTGAALTGSNTWSGSTGTFTVGSGGAGLYEVDLQMVDGTSSIPPFPILDVNGTMTSSNLSPGNPIYGLGIANSSAMPNGSKGRSHLTATLWMATGDSFIVRCLPGSTVIGVTFSTNGTTYLRIIKLR